MLRSHKEGKIIRKHGNSFFTYKSRKEALFLFSVFIILSFGIFNVFSSSKTIQTSEIEGKVAYLSHKPTLNPTNSPLKSERDEFFIPMDDGYKYLGSGRLQHYDKKNFTLKNYNFTSIQLIFSTPKSGTTVLTWMNRVIYDYIRPKNDKNVKMYTMNGDSILVNEKTKKGLIFTTRNKHAFVFTDCFGNILYGKETPKEREYEEYLISNNISPISSKGLKYLEKIFNFDENLVKKNLKCKVKQLIILREPIQGAFSWLKYMNLNLNLNLNKTEKNLKFLNYCKITTLRAGSIYQLFKIILPNKVNFLNYKFIFYKDLIQNKQKFIKNFIQFLEIYKFQNEQNEKNEKNEVKEEDLINEVLKRTSREFMNKIQNSLREEHNDKTIKSKRIISFYQGLSSKGRNSRKISNKKINILNSIEPETIEECKKLKILNIPKELLEKYESCC